MEAGDAPGLSAENLANAEQSSMLTRFMLLSLATALVTLALKAVAASVTGSVGFLSDAMESGVNVVAAVVGIAALRTAAQPADSDHHFGHGKAEYLSAAVEGGMILIAAIAILWTAGSRLLDPTPLEQPAVGLVLSTIAAVFNLAVGLILIKVGRSHRSITLLADGKHLLTDVWTSAGVLVGIGLVALFQWEILDPLVALAVGVNILFAGYGLLRRSVTGLLDAALPPEEAAQVKAVIDQYRQDTSVSFGPVRTRESGRQRFIYLTIRVPGDWSVRQGHDLADRIEDDLADELPGSMTFTHVEPNDRIPRSARKRTAKGDPKPAATRRSD